MYKQYISAPYSTCEFLICDVIALPHLRNSSLVFIVACHLEAGETYAYVVREVL